MACSLMPTGKKHSHIGCLLKWFSKFAAVSEVGLFINAFSTLFMMLPLVYLFVVLMGSLYSVAASCQLLFSFNYN